MTIEDVRLQPAGRPSSGGRVPADGDVVARTVYPRRLRGLTVVLVGLALGIGLVARFLAVSPLWLDEALTVNIARLPVGDLLQALRHDGAPPLYYLLLHVWIDMAGTGDVAVRALSGLLSAGCLPLMWLVGRRLAAPGEGEVDGRPPGSPTWLPWAAVLLLASSPFAIRYATEARMYSLVVLLVLAGFLALDSVLRRRSVPARVGLAVVTGLLLLTHYWAFFLVGAVVVVLAWRWRTPEARRALLSIGAGSLLFVPWLPSFVEQMGTTGTPWGLPPKPRTLFDIVLQFSAGLSDTALPLGLLVYGLIALGLFGAATGRGLVTLDLRGRPPGRAVAAVAVLTMAAAVVVGQATSSAFAIRYAAVVLPLVLLLAALGTRTLADIAAGPLVLGLAVALGLVTSIPHMAGDRTTAARVGAALRAEVRPGDVVAYCPDQLGPSVSRVLDRSGGGLGLVQLTFPRATGPEFVDWVGYQEANEAAATAPFARMLLDRAGPDHAVWVVWAPNYRTFDTKCQGLLADLRQVRPQERRVVMVSTNTLERPGLVVYPPG